MRYLAIQLSGSTPNAPPLGMWIGIGLIVLIIIAAKRRS